MQRLPCAYTPPMQAYSQDESILTKTSNDRGNIARPIGLGLYKMKSFEFYRTE